ncbi:MAG TPA: tRNA lysidine(34) synthetase TilS [Burkholderiales bacterium]|nr:tRNA lysidine(34) synthetase TilS [Burkholderiales bacterium]
MTTLVALSGGPDSSALLLMLRERGVDVVAAHYDHALQPASADVARQVALWCDELGVELISERRRGDLPKGSIQAAARTLRYEFLERTADRCGASTIALGHTADDVVEGAVLHLMRGAGIAGLRGMPDHRGRFMRPLLDTWRSEIDAFLRERGVTPQQDPANTNRRFARVRVRLDLLPALERDRPGIVRRLRRVARRAAELQESIVAEAERVLGGGAAGAAVIAALPEPVAAECMRTLYRRAGGAEPGLSRAQIRAMLALLASRKRGGRGIDLPGGLRFRVVGSRAEVVSGVVPLMDVTMLTRSCHGCSEAGAAHLRPGLELKLAFRRPGMRIHQRRGTRKLQDVFVDARVPREERDGWPLVMSGERLAWVPGVAIDDELVAIPGEPSTHVTVTRMLSGSQRKPVLESANSPRGESS